MNTVLEAPPKQPEVAVVIARREHPAWKRKLDLIGVLCLLPCLSPLLIAVAIYIRLVSRGPVFFIQSRVGFGGEKFHIIKFRTMHVPAVCRDADHRNYIAGHVRVDGPVRKPNLHKEMIPGGRLLRKLSIDELPQLFNVLQGNMSLVGPRPDLLQVEDYEPWQLRRFEVLPGMTGLWQVSGKNRLTFDQMVDLDIRYVEARSLKEDVRILAKTLFVLLFDRNE